VTVRPPFPDDQCQAKPAESWDSTHRTAWSRKIASGHTWWCPVRGVACGTTEPTNCWFHRMKFATWPRGCHLMPGKGCHSYRVLRYLHPVPTRMSRVGEPFLFAGRPKLGNLYSRYPRRWPHSSPPIDNKRRRDKRHRGHPDQTCWRLYPAHFRHDESLLSWLVFTWRCVRRPNVATLPGRVSRGRVHGADAGATRCVWVPSTDTLHDRISPGPWVPKALALLLDKLETDIHFSLWTRPDIPDNACERGIVATGRFPIIPCVGKVASTSSCTPRLGINLVEPRTTEIENRVSRVYFNIRCCSWFYRLCTPNSPCFLPGFPIKVASFETSEAPRVSWQHSIDIWRQAHWPQKCLGLNGKFSASEFCGQDYSICDAGPCLAAWHVFLHHRCAVFGAARRNLGAPNMSLGNLIGRKSFEPFERSPHSRSLRSTLKCSQPPRRWAPSVFRFSHCYQCQRQFSSPLPEPNLSSIVSSSLYTIMVRVKGVSSHY